MKKKNLFFFKKAINSQLSSANINGVDQIKIFIPAMNTCPPEMAVVFSTYFTNSFSKVYLVPTTCHDYL